MKSAGSTPGPGAPEAADSSILKRLKRETHAIHEQVELRVDVLQQTRTQAGYRRLLEAFYGLYCPMEAQLFRSRHRMEPWVPDLADRMRTPRLCQDLEVLGNNRPEALTLAPIPDLDATAGLFGCLYVLEGSTLGGQVISRHIHSQLHYTPEKGCAFFGSHGAAIGTMWKRFGEGIEAYARLHPFEHDEIITSAAATFEAFASWSEKTL